MYWKEYAPKFRTMKMQMRQKIEALKDWCIKIEVLKAQRPTTVYNRLLVDCEVLNGVCIIE